MEAKQKIENENRKAKEEDRKQQAEERGAMMNKLQEMMMQ